MSVKADVKIMLLKSNYEELNKQIQEQEYENYELSLWNNKIEERFIKANNEFVILSWNYVKWDYDTNEIVEKIVNYLRKMELNNLPCRYIAIYDVGTEEEICSCGTDNNILPYIMGCMYVSKEIKINNSFYEL